MSDATRATDQIADIVGLSAALAAKQATSEKNQANGYPGLDALGDLIGTFIPRFGTAASLAAIVPTNGEHVYETDTRRLKVGDGATTTANLQPVGGLPYTTFSALHRLIFQAPLVDTSNVTLADINLASYAAGAATGAAISIDIEVIAANDIPQARRQIRRALAMTVDLSTFTLDGGVTTPIADVGSLAGTSITVSITSGTHLTIVVACSDDSEPVRWSADVRMHVVIV